MFGIADRLGIDLGTANIVVFARKRGIVIREPSVVAVERRTRRVLAVGEEAREMLGRTPGNIVAMRPRDMLAHLIRRACGRPGRFFKPLVVICVPSAATSVEKRAALDAARSAGAREAIPIEEPMAAAIGAGLPIASPGGNMVVDIGGGTTDVAVISLGGIVVSDSLRVGGNHLDEAIIRHIKRVYSLDIGEPTSERIKMTIGSAYDLDEELDMDRPAEDHRDQLRGGPLGHLRAGVTGCRPGEDNSRADASRTGGGYYRARHYPHRRRRTAARPGSPVAPGDRHPGDDR